MRQGRRQGHLLGPTLALALLAAGCGGGETSPPGESSPPPEAEAAPSPQPEGEPSPAGERLLRRQEERARWRAENPDAVAAARISRTDIEEKLLAELGDPDPDVRSDAAYYIDLDHPGARERVIALGRQDPEARVRAAAAEALGDDDTHAAVSALLEMLADPDAAVVLAAVEALEDAGDASIIGRLTPLEEHPDPAVRAAAREAIEYLE